MIDLCRYHLGCPHGETCSIWCRLDSLKSSFLTVVQGSVVCTAKFSFAGRNEHDLFKAFGVFGLCQLYAFVEYLRSKMSKENFDTLLRSVVLVVAGIVGVAGMILSITGKIAPWTGRFYSLLDPSYAKNNIPIIASVSEHQPTAWSSFYFDLQLLVFMFPGE